MSVDDIDTADELFVDAVSTQSFARYINHAPGMRANAKLVTADTFPVIMTTRYVAPGEEILYDYGLPYFCTGGGRPLATYRGFRHDGSMVRRSPAPAPSDHLSAVDGDSSTEAANDGMDVDGEGNRTGGVDVEDTGVIEHECEGSKSLLEGDDDMGGTTARGVTAART